MSLEALRRLLLENWGLKLLSLVFALLLWMFVVGEKRSEVSLSPPLELARVPQNMVIVSRVPESIRVRLNGPRTLLAAISPQQVAVSLDMEGLQPGISAFEILPSRLNLPRGVEVTYISPSVVTLEADQKVRKVVPVKPRTKGTPAEGFELADVRAVPAEVEVEGADRALRQMKEVPTEAVDVTGAEGSITRPVAPAFPDPTVKLAGKQGIQVEVVIREAQVEREFLQVPIQPPPGGWTLTPAAVDLKVTGGLRIVSKLRAKDLGASVPPVGDKAPVGPLTVTVAVPEGVQILTVTPASVKVSPPAPPSEGGAAVPGERKP